MDPAHGIIGCLVLDLTDHQLIERLRIKCQYALVLLEDNSGDLTGCGRLNIAASYLHDALMDIKELESRSFATDRQLIERLWINCQYVLALLENEREDLTGCGRQRVAAAYLRYMLTNIKELEK